MQVKKKKKNEGGSEETTGDEPRWDERIKWFSSFSFVGISFTYIYILHTHTLQSVSIVRKSYKCASINKIHSSTYTQCALSERCSVISLLFLLHIPLLLFVIQNECKHYFCSCCCCKCELCAMSLKCCFPFSHYRYRLHNKKNILIMLNQHRWDNFFVLRRLWLSLSFSPSLFIHLFLWII